MGTLDATSATARVAVATDLQEIAANAKAAGSIGLDTEFMREKTYRARLCLVQVATQDQIWIVDPTETGELSDLGAVLANPEIEKVVHAGRQDFEIFYELYGAPPSNVFDVQLAASFAGYGSSLSYGRLVEALVGVTLTKGESYTDWCRRPLTRAQLTYAADDVRYLEPIASRLKEELRGKDRLEWVREEMSFLEDEGSYRIDPAEVWRRVSGRGSLSGRQTAVLKELARWREELAVSRDIPRGWVVKDATLVEIARRGPKNPAELKAIRGINAREAERSAREIFAAVQRGRRAEPVAKPPTPSKTVQARARMVSGLADALVRARCEKASLATELVATRGELEGLLVSVFSGRLDEDEHRLLKGWRRQIAGEAVLALATGKLAVRVLEDPPYIEEVEV